MFTAPSPECQRLVAAFASQRRRALNHEAEQDRAIVLGELDQPGFGNEPAKFDQLARSLAALHDPASRAVTRDLRL